MSKSKPIITAVEILERELRGLQEAYGRNKSTGDQTSEMKYTDARIKATMQDIEHSIKILTEIQQ